VAPNEQANIHFNGKGNENHELGTVLMYRREIYRQLRG
jgi:hypothetical protein